MKDNRGLTLVELLVAFAVSAIVLTALGYLLITGLKLYGRNNAHVEVQSEAQTTMNLIIDNIMEAEGICIVNPAAGADTECVLLGDLLVEENGSSYDVYFKGNAIVTDIDSIGENGRPIREMYLLSFPNDDFAQDSGKAGYCKLVSSISASGSSEAERKGSAAKCAWQTVRDYLINELNEEERTKWLLARYITGCRMEVERTDTDFYKETLYYWNGSAEDFYYYKEPVSIKVEIALEYDYGSGKITRTLSDSAAVRSRIDKLYVEKDAAMYEYGRKK